MNQRTWLIVIAAFFILAAAAPPPSVIIHATQSGKVALDRDAHGGNPFATALVDMLARPDLALGPAFDELREATLDHSNAAQKADVPDLDDTWQPGRPAKGEKRLALVVAFAGYSPASGLPPLPGAAFDAARVGRALGKAGYATEMLIAADLPEFRAALARFGQRAKRADTALIYTTGHGFEADGRIFLLAPDYPREQGRAALSSDAITLAEISTHANARRRNLVFYGGCRDDPFAMGQ